MSFFAFSKEKFFSLSLPRRHKKAAECLRFLFEKKIHSIPSLEVENSYRQMESWLALPHLHEFTHELSNRYHLHLKEAGLHVKEHNLLSTARHFDTVSSMVYLPITIYLDRLRSAGNVGSILRTVEAFRLGSVAFSPETPFIDTYKVQKTSMGSIEHLKCLQTTSLDEAFPIIALETTSNASSLFAFRFPEKFTLIIGNEEYGVSESLLRKADHILSIPLFGAKNSLNVAVAFGISAFEISRQLR